MKGKRLAAAGVALGLFAFTAACSSDEDEGGTAAPEASDQPNEESDTSEPGVTGPDTSDGGEDADARAIDPSRGIRIVTTGPPPSTWDPAAFQGSTSQLPKFYNAVYDTLLRVDHEGVLQPLLATEYEYDETNTVLTLTLRDDVVFTDGTPFDAEAAKINLERVQASSSSTSSLLQGIASIEAPSPTELVITQEQPTAKIIQALASPSAVMVSPTVIENDPGSLTSSPVGTGPYTIGALSATEVTFERNDDYWDTETVFPASQTYLGATDPNARINALLSGQVDFADLSQEPPTPDILAMVESGELEMVTLETAASMIGMNSNIPPLDNENVRLAINHAIDRVTYNDVESDGLCEPTSQLFLPGQPGYIEGLEYEYDPDLARELMEESGVGEVTIPYQSIAGTSQAGPELYADMLSEIGITLDIQQTAVQDVFRNFFAGQWPLSALRLFSSMPDVVYTADFLAGPMNPGEVPEELQEMVDEAAVMAPDDPDRTAAYEAINQYAFDHAIVAPICNSPKTLVYNPDVVGVDEITLVSIGATDTTRMGMAAS